MVIGIVTISYNQGRFLKQAMESVRVGGGNEVEYVIVDPGSFDGSRDIIQHAGSRFTTVILEPDHGPADGLNKGFAGLKRAAVCGYLNADDRLAPDALDYVCWYFDEHPKVDVLFGSILIIDQNGRPSLRARRVQRFSLREYSEGISGIWQPATFFRRETFLKTTGFNVANKTCWDSELVVDMVLGGASVGYTERILGDFRIYEGSLTNGGIHNTEAHFRSHEFIKNKIRASGVQSRPVGIARIARAFNKLNPYRHASNVVVGTCEVMRRRLS